MFPPAHPSLKDESKFYATINKCCAVLLLLATHLSCATKLNGVLGSCCKFKNLKLNYTGGFLKPLETPLPTPLFLCDFLYCLRTSNNRMVLGMDRSLVNCCHV